MIQKEKIANFKMTTKRYKILIKKFLRCKNQKYCCNKKIWTRFKILIKKLFLRCKSKTIAPTKRYKIQDIDKKKLFLRCKSKSIAPTKIYKIQDIDKKWQVALVKLDPWCELICRQVEKKSASWYSFKYRLVFGGTGSVEGGWYLEELGQY